MYKKVFCILALCLALSVFAKGGDMNNPGVVPTPTPEEITEQSTAAESSSDETVALFVYSVISALNSVLPSMTD